MCISPQSWLSGLEKVLSLYLDRRNSQDPGSQVSVVYGYFALCAVRSQMLATPPAIMHQCATSCIDIVVVSKNGCRTTSWWTATGTLCSRSHCPSKHSLLTCRPGPAFHVGCLIGDNGLGGGSEGGPGGGSQPRFRIISRHLAQPYTIYQRGARYGISTVQSTRPTCCSPASSILDPRSQLYLRLTWVWAPRSQIPGSPGSSVECRRPSPHCPAKSPQERRYVRQLRQLK